MSRTKERAGPCLRDKNVTDDEGVARVNVFPEHKARPYRRPTIEVYDSSEDRIPVLNDGNVVTEPVAWQGVCGDEDEQLQTMKYLHASLWVAIGILYTTRKSS